MRIIQTEITVVQRIEFDSTESMNQFCTENMNNSSVSWKVVDSRILDLTRHDIKWRYKEGSGVNGLL